ncbi:MAG: methyltransferase domain-containing protein [Pyrinomonadaceae bacterium]
MHLAYFSPLGPQRSGISDYSEELLPHLSLGADITLMVDGFTPSNPDLLAHFPICDYRRQPAVLRSLKEFDAVIYHMGNDHRYHSGILDAIREHPGIIIFHDFGLQDFFMGLAQRSGDLRIYLDELAVCHGEVSSREAAEILARGGTPSIMAHPTDFPLNSRLARAAEGIVVHSQWSRARFAEIAPDVPVSYIAMPVNPPAEDHRSVRTSDKVQVANFGLITPGKGIEHALRALSALKATHDFRYTLVGDPNAFFDVGELIRRYDLTDRVHITGHVTLEEFQRYITETDIALNLRERTVGETSASLCRIMAGGVCSIVADVGWYAELPGDSVVKVPLDSCTDELLRAYLQRLMEDANLRTQIGENARRHALAEHNIERSAAEYLTFIRKVIARRPRRTLAAGVGAEIGNLGIGPSDEEFLRGISVEVAALTPLDFLETGAATPDDGYSGRRSASTVNTQEGVTKPGPASTIALSKGRLSKIEGVDYKRAAVEYLSKLSPERSHHLRTKPFYNLANKPSKYKGEGMDQDMHRHFCDFANMAVKLALPPGSRVLDVGCGSGWLSEYFARLGYYVKGIDISADLIEMSRERVARVPYGVDHETPLLCDFAVHDIELTALDEKFDLVICYDSLHHFQDEHAVMRNLAAMLEVGGLLFLLEGQKPDDNSRTADELRSVMREFGTLELPFSTDYLRTLVSEHGFAVVGDYVSVDGLFEREMLHGSGVDLTLPLRNIPTDYHYLTCMKVVENGPATSVVDSRNPGVLLADIALRDSRSLTVAAGKPFEVPVSITNTGDTLWLTGQTVRAGIVMPGVRILDQRGEVVSERHGHPMLPRAIVPGQTFTLNAELTAPTKAGVYTAKVDLVDQHVCWFEERGSKPLVFSFTVDIATQ